MILLMILLIILLILCVVALAFLSIGGAIGYILFGDMIVCIFILVWLIKKIRNRKKKQ